MKSKGFWVLRGLKIAVFGAAFIAAASAATMLLWNWLMPAIFGLGAITWLQALGLLALARILFGGKGHWGGGHHHNKHAHWREKMAARWESMSDEEKARFKSKWQGRCGHKGHGMPWDQEERGAAAG